MSATLDRLVHGTCALIACAGLASRAAAQADLVGWGQQVFDTRWKSQDFVQVDAGETHALALRPDGSVVAWGNNSFGDCEVPALPAGLTYVQVSAGNGSSAVRSDGQISTWGGSNSGGVTLPPLPPGTSYLHVSTGESHRAALRSDGQVVCWGSNSSFQCDVPPLPIGTAYVQVRAGGFHTVALRSDGTVVAWGWDLYDQASPPPPPPGKLPVAVDAGQEHSAVLYDDGSVECWGKDSSGQCDVPALPDGLTWVQVSLGNLHSLGLVSDGSVRTWGLLEFGLAEIPSLPPGVKFTQVSAGYVDFLGLSVALRSDHRYVAWGSPFLSQTNAHGLPSGVEPVDVDVGNVYTHVLGSDGSVTSWGPFPHLQLPTLPPGTKYVAVTGSYSTTWLAAVRDDGQIVTVGFQPAPALPAGTLYSDVAAGAQTVCYALRSDGKIVAWGPDASAPPMVVPGLPPGLVYTSLSCGSSHRIALRSDGKAISWGYNDWGQLNPPALPAGMIYVEAEAGGHFSVARRSDGALVQWGLAPAPLRRLGSGESFVDVELGLYHGLARTSDGSAVGWGEIEFGKSNVPTQAVGEWFSVVSGGSDHSAAMRRSDPPCGGVVAYCGTPAVNSTGAPARLKLAGCAGLSANGLSVELDGLPPSQLGILIYSTQVAAAPFGQGKVCLGGQIVRVLPPLVAGPSGTATATLDLTQPPFSSGQGQVLPGSLWNFQFWYRDPAAAGAGFNLSDGAHVVFAP